MDVILFDANVDRDSKSKFSRSGREILYTDPTSTFLPPFLSCTYIRWRHHVDTMFSARDHIVDDCNPTSATVHAGHTKITESRH